MIGPIHLPAGGIQRANYLESSKQIVVNSECSIYCSPHSNSKELRLLPVGSTLSILHDWIDIKQERWVRIKLSSGFLMENANQPNRGWIKA